MKLFKFIPILLMTLTATPAFGQQQCNTFVIYDPNDTSVNVRTAPNGNIIRGIPNGSKTSVTGEQQGWYKVTFDSRFDDITGFMKKELLWRSTRRYAMDSKDTYVNLRESPEGRVIRQVRNGTPLTVLEGNTNQWAKVRLENGSGTVGYMYNSLIADPSCDSN
ncbi:SH3 domain-containing protein [Limnoraphis robusta Tam1]|uniref:SH3 domain-containing protein n=1 Tax=Limnoraphis robusta CCNP1315 TaxID=3110306 RepID=A0ABU5U0N8_9CYAN|nr:SH3 domain-containing protein [Limnoraphis robusta]MEA5497910.1 SH3 domain-containing protein [Limnoraphis robusta BA-68 BA1]MEA5520762.1 SH3 domain-containing protein [Limnoraphis robusta CCNP1315]MEA5539999.1 SH3 domain-containing protein [Limnoraphis robusta Tam1]MEA5549235.1 SH3 domain-containing protein [Limnoraphis robusta CCNP1324]